MSSGKTGYTQSFSHASDFISSSPFSLTDSVPIKCYSGKNHGHYILEYLVHLRMSIACYHI